MRSYNRRIDRCIFADFEREHSTIFEGFAKDSEKLVNWSKAKTRRKVGGMNIVYSNDRKQAVTTNLNDIPVGQVFRGEMTDHSGKICQGVYLKQWGAWQEKNGATHAVLVIDIDPLTHNPAPGVAGFWISCVEVRCYEPLNATLTLSPV